MDAILKPHGTATVLLFSAQFDSELPTMGKLKRALGTDHIKIYKATGYHSYVVQRIEELVDHMRNFGNSSGRSKINSTHVMILPLGYYAKVLATLAYSAQLVGGFNLTTTALDELETIGKKRWNIDRIACTAKEIRETLERSQEAAERVGMSDPSLQAAIDQHDANFDSNYGQGILEEYQRQQRSWYERYTWRDRRDIAAGTTDSEIPLAA